MPAPKDRPPSKSTPSTETTGVVQVNLTANGLHQAVSLARFAAKAQEGPGDDWISDTSHILYGLERAIYGISWAGMQPLNGPIPDADVSKKLLENMRDLALDFLAENGYHDRPKHTRPKDFKRALVVYMIRIDTFRIKGPWGKHDSSALATFLQTGTILFPKIAQQDFATLVANLEQLGPDFLKKTKRPIERIEKVFAAAGLPSGDFSRLSDVARRKRKSRQAAKEGAGA